MKRSEISNIFNALNQLSLVKCAPECAMTISKNARSLQDIVKSIGVGVQQCETDEDRVKFGEQEEVIPELKKIKLSDIRGDVEPYIFNTLHTIIE